MSIQVVHEFRTKGSTVVKTWPEAMRKIRAIKRMVKRDGLIDSSVDVDECVLFYNRKPRPAFKISWSYVVPESRRILE